jgi:hypothetical protein
VAGQGVGSGGKQKKCLKAREHLYLSHRISERRSKRAQGDGCLFFGGRRGGIKSGGGRLQRLRTGPAMAVTAAAAAALASVLLLAAMSEALRCPPDTLAVYRAVLSTHWTRDLFPKQYPEVRPPAQWSRLLGESFAFLLLISRHA